jgi:hypothetical protein
MRVIAYPLLLCLTACDTAAPAVASTGACGGAEPALAMSPRTLRVLPPSATPADIALLADGSLVVAERGSSGVSIYSPGSSAPRWISAPEPLPVLTIDRGDLIAAGIQSIYRIDPASGRIEVLAEVPVRTGRIVSMAADRNTLWVSTGGSGSGTGAVYAAARVASPHWRHVPLGAPAHLESIGGGRVAAASVRYPHQVTVIDSFLHSSDVGSGRSRPRNPGADESTFTQGLIALDCGRLLQVVSDMRSNRRMLHVYQTGSVHRLIRSRTIAQPLGFVHAAAGNRLVAVREAGGRREVVLFAWSWQPNQEES